MRSELIARRFGRMSDTGGSAVLMDNADAGRWTFEAARTCEMRCFTAPIIALTGPTRNEAANRDECLQAGLQPTSCHD